MEVLQAIGWFFSMSWDFFTEVQVPGFGFSFAALFVGLFLAALSLRLLGYMFGFGSISSGDGIQLLRITGMGKFNKERSGK